MNSIAKHVCWCIALVWVLAPAVYGGEKETHENPIYKHWAQFKPGTFVVLEQINETGDEKSVTITTYTLKEVTARKAVVEMKQVAKMGDETFENEPQIEEHPATYTVEKTEAPPEHQQQELPGYKMEKGEEKLEVAGQKVATEWLRTEFKQGPMMMVTKTWTSDKFPGQVVKTVMESTGEYPTKTTTRVVKFEIKK